MGFSAERLFLRSDKAGTRLPFHRDAKKMQISGLGRRAVPGVNRNPVS
jgi:hypothetical protein